jgi:hypothetical protein
MKLGSVEGDMPAPSIKFRKRIQNLSDIHRRRILEIRELILSFDERIKEIVEPSAVFYGKSKLNLCAEIKIRNLTEPHLFLWLPNTRVRELKNICRMKITSSDLLWVESFHQHSVRGYAIKKLKGGSRTNSLNTKPPQEFIELSMRWDGQNRKKIQERYGKILNNPDRANSLDLLIEIALDEWLTRVNKR